MTDMVIDDEDGGAAEPQKAERFNLGDHLESFPERVVSLTVPRREKDWRRKLQREWDNLREQFADKTLGTRKVYMSKFRKAASDAILAAETDSDRAKKLVADVRGVLEMDQEVLDAIAEEGRKRIRSYSTSLVRIEEWRAILEELQLLLHHPDPRFIAIGLMGVTGRRFAEVLSAGQFGPAYRTLPGGGKMVQKYEVAFAGQLKTKKAEGTLYGQTYVIPVNADSRAVLDAVERLRESDEGRQWAEMTPAELNVAVNRDLNRTLQGALKKSRSVISGLWPKDSPLSLKELRPFYAEVAYHYHAPETITKGAYFAKILGHREDDHQSALSYMKYVLFAKDASPTQVEIKRLEALKAERQAAYEDGLSKQKETDQ